jgi:hypothetical protein
LVRQTFCEAIILCQEGGTLSKRKIARKMTKGGSRMRKTIILVLAVCIAIVAMQMVLPAVSEAVSPVIQELDKIPPSWSQKLPASERFELVLDGAGVLDKETGLVWEQSPMIQYFTWEDAVEHCIGFELGGRKGWHLPTIEQLASLVDTSHVPALPNGSPFDTDCGDGYCVFTAEYWSSTTDARDNTRKWYVNLKSGNVGNGAIGATFAMCVRGGQSHDGY